LFTTKKALPRCYAVRHSQKLSMDRGLAEVWERTLAAGSHRGSEGEAPNPPFLPAVEGKGFCAWASAAEGRGAVATAPLKFQTWYKYNR